MVDRKVTRISEESSWLSVNAKVSRGTGENDSCSREQGAILSCDSSSQGRNRLVNKKPRNYKHETICVSVVLNSEMSFTRPSAPFNPALVSSAAHSSIKQGVHRGSCAGGKRPSLCKDETQRSSCWLSPHLFTHWFNCKPNWVSEANGHRCHLHHAAVWVQNIVQFCSGSWSE